MNNMTLVNVRLRWKHEPEDPKCNCLFPRLWASYPVECHNCMRLLGERMLADPSECDRNSQEGEITLGSLPPHQIAHKATAQAEARGEFNGYPDRDAARRYYESGYLRCLLRLLLTDPTERGVWWCNTHERQAAGPAGCDPKLAGITMTCRVVYAAIEVPPVIKYYPSGDITHAQAILDMLREHDRMRRALIELGHSAAHGIPNRVTGQNLADELRERASQAPPDGLIIIDPKEAFRCGDEHWRDLTDPQMRVKAGDMAREANDDTWTDVPPSWIDTRIGDHQRVHFRRQTHRGLTDTEIVNRLAKHFVQINVVGGAGRAPSNYTAIFIHRGALRQRAIEIPE